MLDPRLLLIPAGVLVLLLAQLAAALWPKRMAKKKPALPGLGYTLVYADQPEGERESGVEYSRLLHDPRHNLQGKPDLIYASNGSGRMLPVELKSGKIGDEVQPRKGDLMQLAAYFLLIEAEYGQRPKEGRLIYSDGMFVVVNTRRLRKQLLAILDDMRMMPDTPGLNTEAGFAKCRRCPCRGTVCEVNP